jgi:hypothetical protein
VPHAAAESFVQRQGLRAAPAAPANGRRRGRGDPTSQPLSIWLALLARLAEVIVARRHAHPIRVAIDGVDARLAGR